MASHFESQLARILADRTSGSRSITQQLVDLLSAARLPLRVQRDDLAVTARSILKSAPSFALVFDLFHTVMCEAFHSDNRDETLGRDVHDAIRRWADRWRDAMARTAESAGELLKSDWTIATLSNSGSVLRALQHAQWQGKQLNVIGAESHPGGEGIVFLRSARTAGCRTLAVPDDEFTEALRDSDILLLGADAVFNDSFWNKIGSLSAATAARDSGIPLVVVGETQKWAPASWNMSIRPVQPLGTLAQLKSSVTLFESVPLAFVSEVACERGLVGPSELPITLAAKPCARNLLFVGAK